MCVYCNGDLVQQMPLNNQDYHTVWTILPDKGTLEIVTCELSPKQYSCKIKFCPMCGRDLSEV